ncbi:MAG TPA: response regulator [Myxococcaceae bacterium]|jgi:CheY-like chemotaxis protein
MLRAHTDEIQDRSMAIRVLVVDDDPDWREYLRLTLSELGYEVDLASSGAEALAALDRHAYAVLLLDHYMPGMSGEEVMRRMHSPAPRVVLVTNARADEVSRALSSGPFYYLPKDASADQLQLLLSSLVLPM